VRREDAPRLLPADEVLAGREADQPADGLAGARAGLVAVLGQGVQLPRGGVAAARRVVPDVHDVADALARERAVAPGPGGQDRVLVGGGPAQAVGREADVHAAVVPLRILAAACRLPVGQLEAVDGV